MYSTFLTAGTASSALTTALSDIDFSVIMDGIVAVLPIVLPVVIGLLALRKGIAFLKSMISGA